MNLYSFTQEDFIHLVRMFGHRHLPGSEVTIRDRWNLYSMQVVCDKCRVESKLVHDRTGSSSFSRANVCYIESSGELLDESRGFNVWRPTLPQLRRFIIRHREHYLCSRLRAIL